MLNHADVGKEVNHIAKPPLVQFRAGKILRQNVLQPLVFLFNGTHGVINRCADFLRMCFVFNVIPPRALWYEEDTLRGVLVDILLEAVALCDQLLMLLLETIGNVFEENQPQYHVFVFGCIHITAQHTRCIPNLFFKADIGIISRHK